MTGYISGVIPQSRFYTKEQILNELYFDNGTRTSTFKAYLLNRNDVKIGEIPLIDGSVNFSAFGQIKRNGSIKTKYKKDIDYLTERLQPHFVLKMPKEDIEFPLGVFLIATAPPEDSGFGIDVELQCYDKTIILARDVLDKFETVPEGTNIINECVKILSETGFVRISATPNEAVTQRTLTFEPGTSKLQMINDLLQMINYNVIYFDRNGSAIIEPYLLPIERDVDIEYTASNKKMSVILPNLKNELDLFNIPNKFIVISSNNESDITLTATYENRNPSSPVSIDRIGWKNVHEPYHVTDITNQSVLDDYVKRLAYNYEEKYNKVKFETPNMPFHDYYNCIYLGYPNFEINAKFLETAWSMNFNGSMTHELRRKVEI